ncbi:TIGR01244 family sulfur transferase [Phaeovulum sp. NW3]|uniref:TIGR01244 family sulfur transferase n=1 Tax=Phaeovulum sp. NW3 TaxID=2934933 RepID=UPI0020216101|nr:TIGR01244 family sulfur transferase [Phaeovulum sp. NW3]MCL7464009.1 TIGR01244 family sulfur transferase [Phaeovulum sp. NW3]
MDLRQITPEFAVAPQITPEDVPTLAALGFRTIINNRPDEEIEDALDSDAMAVAAEAAGLAYHHLPYYPGQLTPDLVEAFESVMQDVDGPVLAYCRSGTRSSHLWALMQAGRMALPDILRAAQAAGYDHTALVPLLESRAETR